MAKLQTYLMAILLEQHIHNRNSFEDNAKRWHECCPTGLLDPDTGHVSRAFVNTFLTDQGVDGIQLREFGLAPVQVMIFQGIIDREAGHRPHGRC